METALLCILIAAVVLHLWLREGDTPAANPEPPRDWRCYFERVLCAHGIKQMFATWSEALTRYPFEHEAINLAFYATYANYDKPRWPRPYQR